MTVRPHHRVSLRFTLLLALCLTFAGTLLFLHTSRAHANGTTYYIDNSSGSNCADSGDGQSQPWCNVNAANGHTFQPGDQILLRAGDVWSNEQLAPQGSGSSSNPIVINQYGSGSRPRIDGQGNYQGVVRLDNQSYWQVSNLELTDLSSTNAYNRAGVFVTAPSGGAIVGITIQNMLIHDVTGYKNTSSDGQADATGGIIIDGYYAAPNGITITNNVVHDVGASGIWVYGAQSSGTRATNVTVSYNTVYNVGTQGIWFHTVSGAEVTHNTVHDTGQYNVGGTVAMWDFSSDHDVFANNEVYNTVGNNDGEAFDCDGGVQDSIYEYNYSHDNVTGFFTWYNTDGNNSGCIVRYNISQNDGRAIFNDVGAANNTQVYNNTIYIPSGSTTAISDGSFNSTATFTNNIIDNQGSASSWTENNQPVGGNWDHNILYGAQPANQPGGYEPYEDPQLVNPGGAGIGINTASAYHIQSSSPTINAGVAINNNGGLDFFGNSVCANGGPNIGADNSYNSCPNQGGGSLSIANNNFETPYVGSGNYNAFQINPSGASWSFAGGAGISGNGSGYTSGNPSAPDGAQVAFLQGTGSFSQSISGFQASTSYTVTFQAAQRGNWNQGGQDLQVQLDGSVLGTFKPNGSSYQTLSTAAFTTTSGSHTLTFQGLDTATGDNTAFIDAVTLSTTGSGGGLTAGGTYAFSNQGVGKCLDNEGSTSDSSGIWIWDCGSSNQNQAWTLNSVGNGYYQLVNKTSGKCLDNTGGSSADGNHLQEYSCIANNVNQAWSFSSLGNGYYTIINQGTGKCVDNSGGGSSNGNPTIQWQCISGNQHQGWAATSR